MDAIARSHAQLLTLNAGLMTRAVDGVEATDLLRQPGTDGNPMLWILTHAVATRGEVLKMLGAAWDTPVWAATFRRGSARPAVSDYPALPQVLATLSATAGSFAAALETLTDIHWSAPSPRAFPVPDKSLRGAFAFAVFHETYHVGQLAYLRRWLGYTPLIG